MKVLVAVPASRCMLYGRSVESVLNLKNSDQTDVIFLIGGDDDLRWNNLCRKLNEAREVALAGNYEALLTVESDIIVPPNALELMASVEADVVYGLFVLRFGTREWNVALEMDPIARTISLLSDDKKQEAWGKVEPCVGHGQAICLIWRHVLEAIEFRTERPVEHAQDWYFSWDCQQEGFVQRAHLGVPCGHIDPDLRVFWPDQEKGYVIEE